MQVACGELHTLLLSSYGEVLSCGCGAQGALGHGRDSNEPQARRIDALATIPVTQISAGNAHSSAVTATGSVYTWGRNKHGQLGVPVEDVPTVAYVAMLAPLGCTRVTHRCGCSMTPVRVKSINVDVQQTACGAHHTVFVSTGGAVFTAGRGTSGCLGLGKGIDIQDVPAQVPRLEGVRMRAAAAGQMHTLFLGADGCVWACGANNWGQLGLGSKRGIENVHVPVRVRALKDAGAFHIAAGGDSSIAIRVTRGSVLSRPAGTLPRMAQHRVSCDEFLLTARRATSSTEFRELRRLITDIFSHPAALNASFLKGQSETLWCVVVCSQVARCVALLTSGSSTGTGTTATPPRLLPATQPLSSRVGPGMEPMQALGQVQVRAQGMCRPPRRASRRTSSWRARWSATNLLLMQLQEPEGVRVQGRLAIPPMRNPSSSARRLPLAHPPRPHLPACALSTPRSRAW